MRTKRGRNAMIECIIHTVSYSNTYNDFFVSLAFEKIQSMFFLKVITELNLLCITSVFAVSSSVARGRGAGGLEPPIGL